MTAAQNHSATPAASLPEDADARQSARITVAIAQSTANGHRMTKPYDNGGDFLMAHCRDCGQLVLASANIQSGSALSTQCASVKPAPQAAAPSAPATNAPVGTWAHRSTTFDPSPQFTCQHCGNGYTIVGRSCAKCAKSKELVSDPKRGARHSFMQMGLDHVPVAADAIQHGGIKWKLLTNKVRDGQTAPCGRTHDVSVIYVPQSWDPDDIATVKPDRLTAYPCHEECITVYHQPRPQPRVAAPLQADYADAALHKPQPRKVVAARNAVKLATLKVRRSPNTRRATTAAVNAAYNALVTYRAATAAARGSRRSVIYIKRYNEDIATNGPLID